MRPPAAEAYWVMQVPQPEQRTDLLGNCQTRRPVLPGGRLSWIISRAASTSSRGIPASCMGMAIHCSGGFLCTEERHLYSRPPELLVDTLFRLVRVRLNQ